MSNQTKLTVKQRMIKYGYFVLFKGTDKLFYINRWSGNGNIIWRTTDGYVNKSDAKDILVPYGRFIDGVDVLYDKTKKK